MVWPPKLLEPEFYMLDVVDDDIDDDDGCEKIVRQFPEIEPHCIFPKLSFLECAYSLNDRWPGNVPRDALWSTILGQVVRSLLFQMVAFTVFSAGLPSTIFLPQLGQP